MEMSFIDAVSSVGVPAVISLYLLIRTQSSLDRLTEAINRVESLITAYYSGGSGFVRVKGE